MTATLDIREYSGVVIAFDRFEIDPDRYELRADGKPIQLEPQVFEVLLHLARHPDRVVTKNELLDEVWGSRFVSESALTTRIKTARQALGDDGRAQRYIRTVHGRGYRFIGLTVRSGSDLTDDGGAAIASPARDNLPIERTPLFGRDDDIAAVAAALIGHRLVSLLGIGGTGKTRLSIAAARSVSDRFPDGVWFVDLVPISDANGIELALAETVGLGLDGARDVRNQIVDLLSQRRALIVFDNAEHVADDLAGVLDHLLGHTVEPRFVVTSRVPLELLDERRLGIDPLTVDSGERDATSAPAVALLRSAAERFGAPLDDVDADVLQRICRSLDGLPLALELAAAQLRHLDASAVAERLDHRFDLLADRAHPDRHASLQAVLSDTWDALDPTERTLLEHLAAFPSTFTLDDLCLLAETSDPRAALIDVETRLGGLVDRSLVVRGAGRRSRYRLLETVKLFARQQCDDDRSREIADIHAAWCLAAVGTDPRRYLFDFDLADWCTEHHDDLRAAGRHLRSHGRIGDAARLLAASALAMHVDIGPRASATLELIERDLPTIADDDAASATLHFTGVMCGMATRSPRTIADHGARAVDAARRTRDPALVNAALVLSSWSMLFTDPALALEQTAEASDIAAAADEALGRDFADGYRAFHLAVLRRYEEAEAVARAVVERAPSDERIGYPTYVATSALTVLLCIDNPDEARTYSDKLLGPPNERTSMWARDLVQASAHAAAGDAATASAISEMILARLDQAGQDPWPDLIIPAVAHALQLGDLERAASWLHAIRTAGQPTQSFQATVLYRRLRDAVETTAAEQIGGNTRDIGRAALDWLRTR